MANYHNIKAQLYDNALIVKDPNDLVARVRSERSLSVVDICQSAVSRGVNRSRLKAYRKQPAYSTEIKIP